MYSLLSLSLTKKKHNIVNFLKETHVNFTLSYVDMPSLDLDLVVHLLAVHPNMKPVKQKKRNMHP